MTRLGETSKKLRSFLCLEEKANVVLIHDLIVELLGLVDFLSDNSSRVLGSRWKGNGEKRPWAWFFLTVQ